MYVIAGASGNTGGIVAKQLLSAGKKVKVISRKSENVQSLLDAGAILAKGDLEDEAFLTQEFKGAEAVYALIPPKWDLTEPWRNYQRRIAVSFTNAIEANGVGHVVLLSSNGAHLKTGAGPVSGLHDFEQLLSGVKGLNILTLRAGFFMQNFYANIPMMKQAGIFGYSLKPDLKLPVVHTNDIAEVAYERLKDLDFKGFEVAYVSGAKDYSMNEVAEILSKEINKGEIRYVQFSEEDLKQGMISNGVPQVIADGYAELFTSLNEGSYLSDYKRSSENTTPTTLEEFAIHFAQAYKS